MPAVHCPACRSSSTQISHKFSASDSANHLVAPTRSLHRNMELRSELIDLWGADAVVIRECQDCGFGFADPFRSGSSAVYNLIGGGAQHYPRDKFEFDVTIKALSDADGTDGLLEIGAGSGAFLSRVIKKNLARRIVATEYDDSAVSALHALPGVQVMQGDFRALTSELGKFDAICLFQVLEHLDDLDGVFSALKRLLTERGSIFIAVPNGGHLQVQEQFTGFMDMPPIHIGRWTHDSMNRIAYRHGLHIIDEKTDKNSRIKLLWHLAKYRFEERRSRSNTIASRLDAVQPRPLRGILKRSAAGWDLLALTSQRPNIPPRTRWFQLVMVE